MIPPQKKSQGAPVRGIVIGVIVVVAFVVCLMQYNKYASRKQALDYQRQVAAQRAADEKAAAKAQKEAEAAKRAELDAEESAKEKAAKDKAQAERDVDEAQRLADEANRLAAETAAANAAQELEAFKNGARKFIGAEVAGVWNRGNPAEVPTWCLVPTDSGRGSYYEIIPGADGAKVRTFVDGAVKTLTYAQFGQEVLADHATVLLRTVDDRVWILSTLGESKERTLAMPGKNDEPVDLAKRLYGEPAIKAIKLYRMKPPQMSWNIAFVTDEGRRFSAGTVKFGDTIARDRFVPIVSRELGFKVRKHNAERKRELAADVFTPSRKRTHFFYNGPSIKRTLDGKTYVPRNEPKWSTGSFRSHKASVDAAKHRQEWVKHYNIAKRQEDLEAGDRAAWEKVKKANAAANPALSVNDRMINEALESGSIVYAPVKK